MYEKHHVWQYTPASKQENASIMPRDPVKPKHPSGRAQNLGHSDCVVLMAPPLADQLDAALNENPSRETAVAILGEDAVSNIDARLRWVHSVAGGAWTSN